MGLRKDLKKLMGNHLNDSNERVAGIIGAISEIIHRNPKKSKPPSHGCVRCGSRHRGLSLYQNHCLKCALERGLLIHGTPQRASAQHWTTIPKPDTDVERRLQILECWMEEAKGNPHGGIRKALDNWVKPTEVKD